MSESEIPSLGRQVKCPLIEYKHHIENSVISAKYTWVIDNFTFYVTQRAETLCSSTFSTGTSEWCLELRLSTSKWAGRNYRECSSCDDESFSVHHKSFSLYLKLVSCKSNEVRAKVKLAILNAGKQPAAEWKPELTLIFTPGQYEGTSDLTALTKLLLLNKPKGILHDKKLTIYCKICVLTDPMDIISQSNTNDLSDDLGFLLESKKFSDVVLSASGKEYQVHRSILAARSPVFHAMFENSMLECKQNRVHIEDVNCDVLHEMLLFIYTGKTAKLEEIAADLLAAADKYALEKLKEICEKSLCKNLSVENAIKTLILADLHSAQQLKAKALMFINTYLTKVIGTADWKFMTQIYPHLMSEICSIETNDFSNFGKN